MSGAGPGSVGCTVVVGSSQLITTLSALAYLRWRGYQASVLRIVSPKGGEAIHSSTAFEQQLSRLARAEGHGAIIQSNGPLPLDSEQLSCDLLLLPRLDDQEGQTLIAACPAAEVVELGESIGVETRLYSFSSRRIRQRALRGLQARHGAEGFTMAPLIAIHSAVDLPRLRCLLDLCSVFRQQITKEGITAGVLPPEALLVCLPYLKVRTWRWRCKLAGRVVGWRQPPELLNLAYIRAALVPLVRRHPGQPVWIQPHPKNLSHLEILQAALRSTVGASRLQLLAGQAPLELLLIQQLAAGPAQGAVAGFGTNLLAAAVFLHPHAHRVELCEYPRRRGLLGWWRLGRAAFMQRREWLRRRHVQATLSNLQAALQQLSRQ